MEYLADAFYHTYRLRSLFPSRYGVRRAVFGLGQKSEQSALLDLPVEGIGPAIGQFFGQFAG
ncbi:hypothetical protein H6B10_17080 [Gemmiger formicilis]|nr:hypothetical protein [Gemmiger formicilis]